MASGAAGPAAAKRLKVGMPRWAEALIAEQPWKGGLEPAQDFQEEVCVQGGLPDGLAGTLFMAGPGRIRLADEKHAHWFDGDGSVAAVSLEPSRANPDAAPPSFTAKLTHRFVRNPRFQAQARAGEEAGFAARGVWTQARGGVLGNMFRDPTDAHNTAILNQAGRLLVLWEGGHPKEIDPATLQTLDTRPLSLPAASTFSAHPKRDPATGALYNHGAQLSARGTELEVMRVEGEEVVQSVTHHLGQDLILIHDSALTENFLVYLLSPWYCPWSASWRIPTGLSSVGGLFQWRPNAGTRCLLVRKTDFSIARDMMLPPLNFIHIANAYESDNKVHILLAQYRNPDRSVLEAKFADMYSASFGPEDTADLVLWTVDPLSTQAATQRPMMPADSGALGLEFPHVADMSLGRNARYVFAAGRQEKVPGRPGWFDALQKLDTHRGSVQVHRLPEGHFTNEPVLVLRPGASAEDDGFLVTLVYNSAKHSSYFLALDAARLDAPPVVIAEFTRHVPFRLHGEFVRARDLALAQTMAIQRSYSPILEVKARDCCVVL